MAVSNLTVVRIITTYALVRAGKAPRKLFVDACRRAIEERLEELRVQHAQKRREELIDALGELLKERNAWRAEQRAEEEMAQDEEKEEEWIDVNGTPVQLKKGQSSKEAAKKFIEKKEAEREAEAEAETEAEAEAETVTSEAEKQKKIDSVNIDFDRDNTLPGLNKEDLAELGVEDKPVLLKKTIIDKNLENHPEVNTEDYNKILGQSLYDPDLVVPGHEEKPYFNFVSRVGENKNTIALLELSDVKSNYEIVNLHWIKDRQRRQKEKRKKD